MDVNDFTDFSGKVVVVTGASRGLGRAMALGFAQCGADVVVSSRKAAGCAAVVQEIVALGRRALAIPCHVGHWEELPQLIDGTIAAFGRIDVLINNAGISPVTASSLAMREDQFDKIIAVNFKGPFRLSALAAPYLSKSGGSIINITSLGALKPDPTYPAYSAAKAALNVVTRAHAMEFGPAVRVNAIMPGPFWTDMSGTWREEWEKTAPSAMRRMGRPEEIVSTALYLASPRSSYTTGTIVQLDGCLL
jgi:NAD(P)-dependent dehydrogenase (short-subunit alcohol dehydrogenase family)